MRFKNNRLGEMDNILYVLGMAALGLVVALVLFYLITGVSVLSIKMPCLFNKLTRLPCPGCGGTRSVRALLRGELLKSIYDYPPLIYITIVYIVFMIRCFLYKHFSIKKSPDGTVVKYIYIFIGLIFIQWFVKLIAQLAFGYYWFM